MSVLREISESFVDVFSGTPELRAAFFGKIAEIVVGGCLCGAKYQLHAYSEE